MNSKLTVLIVHGYPIVRFAIKEYLGRHSIIGTILDAESIDQGLSVIHSHNPDLIITELVFPHGSDTNAVWSMIDKAQGAVIAFSIQESWNLIEKFFDCGGMGFVSKRSPMTDLSEAVRAVSGGRKWIAPLVRNASRTILDQKPCTDRCLTAREREIVVLITKGLTSRQIADQLCVSLKTVETHRYRVFKKLGVRRSAQLADYALRNGLIIPRI